MRHEILGAKGEDVALVKALKEAKANAHLIAAAPELLVALIEIEDEMSAYGELYEPGGKSDKEWRRRIDQARAAIAKAKGKTK